MMKFWSAALVAAVVTTLPAAAMARPQARAVTAKAHGTGHHGAAHRDATAAPRLHGHRRGASSRLHAGYTKAHRQRGSARIARPGHRAQALARADQTSAYQAYAYAPAGEPAVSTAPVVQAPMVTARRADGARVSGLVATLAEKVAQISAACGAQVISGVRHTRVAGTGTMSLHASGQAVDMRGNPGCIYGLLQGWAGGYTTDYGRVHHVHISWGGREQGLRFAHGGGHSRRHAHAGKRTHWAGRMRDGRRG